MKKSIVQLTLMLTLAGAAAARADSTTGTLVVDIAPFTSEITLKKKIQAQLESGGLEWGHTGDRIVFTLVNKRFVNFDIPEFTRFGAQKSVELPAGDYEITCIGLVFHTAFSPEKVLSKGGYFNENLMAVHIEAGKATTLKIKPVIRKQATFFLDFFMPELLTTTVVDGAESEPVSLNAQTDKSVKWDDYMGDLKFRSQGAAHP